MSPCWQVDFLPLEPPGKPQIINTISINIGSLAFGLRLTCVTVYNSGCLIELAMGNGV